MKLRKKTTEIEQDIPLGQEEMQAKYEQQQARQIEQPIQQPTQQQQPIKKKKITLKKGSPIEYLAYNMPKQALLILALGLIALIAPIGLVLIQYLQLNALPPTTELIPLLGYIVIGLVFFIQALIVYKNVIKRGENILIKEMRGGQIIFDKVKVGKKILFNKKDKTTEIKILWNGAGTAQHSGAKVLLLKEGSASNTNINLCVAESDWTKNLSSMVRAKTFADLAESELLETKGLLGMKWQDLLLIVAVVGVIGIAFMLIGLTPDMVSEKVIESLSGGALQNVISSVITPAGV